MTRVRSERLAGYSQQQRVENGAVDAAGHRHACARDGEDDEVERLVDRTLFRRGTATQLQPDQRQGPRESGKAAENAAADADRGVRWAATPGADGEPCRSEEHTSELQSLMRISYAVFCLKKKKTDQLSSRHKSTHCATKQVSN